MCPEGHTEDQGSALVEREEGWMPAAFSRLVVPTLFSKDVLKG